MISIEKAIIKTLVYSDIFGFPLKGWEVHKWLIGRETNISEVGQGLKRLVKKKRVGEKRGFYYLIGRGGLVNAREKKERVSREFWLKTNMVGRILRLNPWIKLVGVSGGLAMNNVSESDDIDLFIIARRNRVWICRLITLLLLQVIFLRRSKAERGVLAAGKICANLLLDEDRLEQHSNNIYIAHEVLQMRVLWQRGGLYSKFLERNDWVFKNLPNWVGESVSGIKYQVLSIKKEESKKSKLGDYLEKLARWGQLKIMKQAKGDERISEGRLYFHPVNQEKAVLAKYRDGLKKYA